MPYFFAYIGIYNATGIISSIKSSKELWGVYPAYMQFRAVDQRDSIVLNASDLA